MAKCGERVTERLSSARDHAVSRYLGLSLGGAKSDRTYLTVVDYYRKQEKAFVVDIYSSIGSETNGTDGEMTSDQVLLSLIDEVMEEHEPSSVILGVDAPLTFPPCMLGCETQCEGYESCKKPEVRWMRQQYQRAKAKTKKLKHFTPYSQRPVDLYFRYKHPEENLFQDETMGANLAPQAVRMNYLMRRLPHVQLIEVWPKLAMYYSQKGLRLSKREVLAYRHLENGVHVREKILERLTEISNIFIYERDLKKFVGDMAAFDSLLCAWVAMQYDLGKVVDFKSDLPVDTGWVQIPDL